MMSYLEPECTLFSISNPTHFRPTATRNMDTEGDLAKVIMEVTAPSDPLTVQAASIVLPGIQLSLRCAWFSTRSGYFDANCSHVPPSSYSPVFVVISFHYFVCRVALVKRFSLQVPDGSISSLYPTYENFALVSGDRRSPKSLKELCIDAVCRSLPDLDGELPPGLPQDLVDAIVKSLIDHAALNATTLRALRNCEIEELCLAGCRGVRDEWLKPFSSHNLLDFPLSPSPPPLCRASFDQHDAELDFMDCDIPMEWEHMSNMWNQGVFLRDEDKKIDVQPPLIPKLCDVETDDCESSSSSSYATFMSATSSPNVVGSDVMQPEAIAFGDQSPSSVAYTDMGEACHISSFCHGVFSPSMTSSLTLLDLRGSQRLTDRGLLQLSALRLLEVVKLDNCHSIGGKGLVALASSNRLHALSLANCRRLTDEAVANVAHLPSLAALSLGGCRCITDRSLYSISNMLNLRKLDISQCDLVTDDGIQELYTLELIEELSIGWCRLISDKGLSALCCQPGRSERLRILHLARCSITNDGVTHLSNLHALEELDLNGCSKIGSAALGSVLERLTKLTSLDVSYCSDIL